VDAQHQLAVAQEHVAEQARYLRSIEGCGVRELVAQLKGTGAMPAWQMHPKLSQVTARIGEAKLCKAAAPQNAKGCCSACTRQQRLR
jgi:hypothetical protein